jgi:hypothetical protein
MSPPEAKQQTSMKQDTSIFFRNVGLAFNGLYDVISQKITIAVKT